jgi:tRNA U55 pseudouridine synthase TruB
MQIIYKEIGETPKEALDKFRAKNPELKDEVLSYMGRLDPMACGEMMILIGKEENQNRTNFMNSNKEYVARFLIGAETDSGDILGLITDSLEKNFEKEIRFVRIREQIRGQEIGPGQIFEKETADDENFEKEIEAKIVQALEKIKKIKRQKFPWFSSKTISGKALFDWFKLGKQNEIERPEKEIRILEISPAKFEIISLEEMQKEIFQKINLVSGDFRQKETIASWQNFFQKQTEIGNECFLIFEIKLAVSSGTYIRGLCEEFKKELNLPVLLYSLNRTRVRP